MTSSRWYAPSIDMPGSHGPFRPEHLKDGDRYEISRGHPIYVSPAGARHGREHIVGALPLATDPAVREVGLDVGYKTNEDTLRAPDIAVGNVPDRPGWAVGPPALAVEYADRGTDEEDLQTKISELIGAGTRFVWVVRLVGPRRVEVYEQGEPLRTVAGGGVLEAPGVLSRPVPVDALFDHDRASEVALANLLARHGFESIAALQAEGHAEGHAAGRAEGHAEGRAEGLRVGIERICALLDLPIDEARRAWLSRADEGELATLIEALTANRCWP